MKVIIPLQLASTRIPNKNIRPFHGTDSLFDIKSKQLLEVVEPGDVYVSSESSTVADLAAKYGFHFQLRDKALTGNDLFMPDYVRGLTDPLPGEDDIMWVHVTSPLFDEFRQALDRWAEVRDEHDSLVAVKRFRAHLVDAAANPVNFAYGYWHKVSQKLPALYTILWSLFILKRSTVKQFSYHVGVNPCLFETDAPVIDIDYEADFALAQTVYHSLRGRQR